MSFIGKVATALSVLKVPKTVRDSNGNILSLKSPNGNETARQYPPMTYAQAAALVAAGGVPDYSTVRITDQGDALYLVVNGAMSPAAGGSFRVTSGSWFSAPSIFRLRLTGTGSISVDAQNALGVITVGVFSAAANSATNQIEFPYLGDDATQMRVNITGSVTVEVL